MLTALRKSALLQMVPLLGALSILCVPTAFSFYRCRMMGTTMSSPCCGEQAEESSDRAAQLRSAGCCARASVAVERPPADTPVRDRPLVTPLSPAPVAVATARSVPVFARPAWTRAQFDAGPSIIVRVCSRLI
jgi:hypothetical protein